MQQHFVVPFGLFPFSAFEFFWFNFFVRIDLSKSQNVLSTFSRVLADVSIYATFHESAWKHFWTCLISVTRFGEILQVFGIFLRVYLLLGKMLSLLWQFCDIIGLIFIVANSQILKNNLTIWSHCLFFNLLQKFEQGVAQTYGSNIFSMHVFAVKQQRKFAQLTPCKFSLVPAKNGKVRLLKSC